MATPSTAGRTVRNTGNAGLDADLRTLPTRDLVIALAQKARELARKEIELAKREVKDDLRTEIKTASGLGVAGVCALCALNLLLVAVVFAFSEAGIVAGWLGSLILAAIMLGIGTLAGLLGWANRVRSPLSTTRRTLKEDVRWAKERLA